MRMRKVARAKVQALKERQFRLFANDGCYASSVENTSTYDKPMRSHGYTINRGVTGRGDIVQDLQIDRSVTIQSNVNRGVTYGRSASLTPRLKIRIFGLNICPYLLN